MTPASTPLNILVIEDNPADFFLFNEYLKRTGLPTNNVLHANRMKEALNLLENNNPDLIFIDLALPDSEGIESFNSINKVASHLSIIVLSGLADKQLALHTIKLGAQDYLVKGSFDETLLAKSIEYSIERKKNLRYAVENLDRYQTIMKATNDTIWDWDLRTDEVSWNEGVQAIFGYPVTNKQTSEAWHFMNIHPHDRERVEGHLRTSIGDGQEQWNDEYRYRCADGSYKSVYDRGFILLDEHGKAYRMIGVMIDITERKRKQEETTRSQVERQKLITAITVQTQEKERKEIGLELHDNINQILATARLYVQVAVKEEEIEKELLYKSYDCISSAITEIRMISKSLIMGSMKNIRLNEALAEIVDNMKRSGLNIRLHVQDDELENLPVDKKLTVYRVIQEQVNNIVKHSKASLADITLVTSGDTLHITIQDHGIGSDHTKPHSGIGLHNIASRVEMQNGKLEVISGTGKGYLLKIQLPLQTA